MLLRLHIMKEKNTSQCIFLIDYCSLALSFNLFIEDIMDEKGINFGLIQKRMTPRYCTLLRNKED